MNDKGHRVSTSFIIEDDKLYDGFIRPHKGQRTLNNIIIKCLTAYFYDEDIRNRILGSASNTYNDKGLDVDLQTKFSEIKNTLLMQDYYTQQMADLMESGNEMSDDILAKANSRAAEQGNYENTTTNSGSKMLVPKGYNMALEAKIELLTMQVAELSNKMAAGYTTPQIPIMQQQPMVQQSIQQPQTESVAIETTQTEKVVEKNENVVDTIKEIQEEIKYSPKEVESTDGSFEGFDDGLDNPEEINNNTEDDLDGNAGLDKLLGSLGF